MPSSPALIGCVAVGVGTAIGQAAAWPLTIPGAERMAILWPPTIVLLVGLLLTRPRLWWLLAATSLAVSLAMTGAWSAAPQRLTMVGANVAQAVAAAALLRAAGFGPQRLLGARGLALFLAIACVSTPLVFSLLSAGLLLGGGFIADFALNWKSRFITNALSAVTLAPPLLIWLGGRTLPPSPAGWAERVSLLAAAVAAEALATRVSDPIAVAAALFTPLPFLLWAAVRHGLAGVALTALAVVVVRIFVGAEAPLSLVEATPAESLLSTQVLILAMTVPVMFLAVVMHDWQRARRELREQSERHRLATAAGGVGAWDWDMTSGAIDLDPSLKALLGYEDHQIRNEIEEWSQHVHPADRERVAAAVEAHVERGEPFEIEHRMLHAGGGVRWFLARGRTVARDARGRPIRMVGTDVDVTDRHRMEDALQSLRMHLQKSARATDIDTFAATIAHEVGQPLFAISANTQACLHTLAAKEPELDEVREAVNEIAAASDRASKVIDRSRALFRNRPMEYAPVSVESLIENSVGILQRQLLDAQIAVTTRCTPRELTVLGDAVHLQQVLDNLISNAVDALHEARAERQLTIEACREDPGTVRLAVQDTGPGIDTADRERVFDPFFSSRPEGLGLGLAIARSIVAAHRGRIAAASVPEGGTRIDIELPEHPAAGAGS